MRRILPIFCLALGLFACSREESEPALFQPVSPAESGVDFANHLTETPAWNIIQYLYFYNGGGVAVGDVNNDGWPDLFFTANQLPNKLYLNQGGFTFKDISDAAGIAGPDGPGVWKTGVTMADVNGDGWLDIYVCQVGQYKGISGRNQLFINNGNQTPSFSEQAETYGLAFSGFSQQAAFFDFDLDGDLDLFLLNHSVHSTESHREAALRQVRHEQAGDRLFRNDGDRHFTDVSEAAGIYGGSMGYGLGLTVSDLNHDGCPDIYISNDFHENDFLYLNQCDGTFTEVIQKATGHTSKFSMGNDIGDLNNDGWMDIVSLDMEPEDDVILKRSAGIDHHNLFFARIAAGYHVQFPRNALQLNLGALPGEARSSVAFAEIAQLAGVSATDWSWSPLLADFDNDGWQDLFITNGIWRRPNDLDYLRFASSQQVQQQATDLEMAAAMPAGQVANYAFRNRGDLTFSDVSKKWGLDLPGCSNGAAYADLDRDGDLDLIVNNLNAPASLYRNLSVETDSSHWLRVRLRGEQPNGFGIGAKLLVKTSHGRMVRELQTTRGWQSSVEPVFHVGLGKTEVIESLTVVWPDRRYQVLENIGVDSTLVLEQRAAAGIFDAVAWLSDDKPPLLREITGNFSITYQHRENDLVEFDAEPLLPQALSTEGPSIATGDVDGNGRTDFYIGGASGQAGRLCLQMADGHFQQSSHEAVFQMHQQGEEVGTAFFDADGDGDLDLAVVGGSNQVPAQDRLYFYRNDGRGNFDFPPEWQLDILISGSCIRPFDVDADGDLDLFVGGRSVPGRYGEAPRSYLLINDGTGRLADATPQLAPDLMSVGMVKDADWLDVTADGQCELVVVGEWLPISIFKKNNNQWKPLPVGFTDERGEIVSQTSGWWNTLIPGDFDGDGDLDFIVGNRGKNSKLRATDREPVYLYVEDIDKNGQPEQLLTHWVAGEERLFASKDEITGRLVSLRKRFPDYQSYAESSLSEIFPEGELNEARRLSAYTFATVLAENKGNAQFRLHSLPAEVQFAPVQTGLARDFNGDGHLDVLLAGNHFGTNPGIGRYDGSPGWLLLGSGDGQFKVLPPAASGLLLSGQYRDMQSLCTPTGRLVLLAENNGPLRIFEMARQDCAESGD